MKNTNNSAPKGFTLIELLVVILIIASLAAVGGSAIVGLRKSADKTLVLGNMRQLQTANISYSTDNQGKFVSPEVIIDDTTTYKWFENPDLVSQLKGVEATFTTSGTTPDVTVPTSLLDPVAVDQNLADSEKLSGSYAYTQPVGENPVRAAQLNDSARSAAFITAESGGFVEHSTRSQIAYRHNDKAVVVYYGGQAALLDKATVSRIDNAGGASNIFWSAIDQRLD